ncbi:MAG: ABC transporter ATP-binding protein [Phycisphaerales bacterium]|nr:ABC transporter ATP-binding protein [Phycisphaerales bacterium]
MLRLTHLRKTFGRIVAVDDLSLSIERGSIFGFLGPNGAGKSTTINMAIGLVKPDSGTVDFDGNGSPMNAEVRSGLGAAPQSIALYDDLTAMENLVLFARLYGMSRADARRRAVHVLELTGLADRKGDRAGGYSGGMKRRLNLAAALLHDPKLLLLDEPTAGVDPQSRNSILDLVRTLRDQGRTIVYTTHYMEEAARLCDRVAIIDHGKLLALDSVDGLIARHGGRSTVSVTYGAVDGGDARTDRVQTDNPVAELSGRLNAPGVQAVRVDRPDLESVFLHLTGRSLRD